MAGQLAAVNNVAIAWQCHLAVAAMPELVANSGWNTCQARNPLRFLKQLHERHHSLQARHGACELAGTAAAAAKGNCSVNNFEPAGRHRDGGDAWGKELMAEIPAPAPQPIAAELCRVTPAL